MEFIILSIWHYVGDLWNGKGFSSSVYLVVSVRYIGSPLGASLTKVFGNLALTHLIRRLQNAFSRNRCYFCLEDEEFLDQLLLHSTKTRILLKLLFPLFGTPWVISRTVKDTLLS